MPFPNYNPSAALPILRCTSPGTLSVERHPAIADHKLEDMLRSDICIAGAGIIGLSLALELKRRGLTVTVLERGPAMGEASTAAAGMLACDDPHNPPELAELAHLSASLYPGFLDELSQLGGYPVPFQTTHTLQSFRSPSSDDDRPLPISLLRAMATADQPVSDLLLEDSFRLLEERSVDPRQLASSLVAAVAASEILTFPESAVVATRSGAATVTVEALSQTVEAAHFIDCTGAWAADPDFSLFPVKGQMLSVALPGDLPLKATVRTGDIYIVPRTVGPNAGRAIIGATIEDAGFDKTVHLPQIGELHRRAAALLPPLANASILESWAGLRPATADRLPLLGPHPAKPRHWFATGHYRNGILLAPATALVMTQLLLGETPTVPLEAFHPSRTLAARIR